MNWDLGYLSQRLSWIYTSFSMLFHGRSWLVCLFSKINFHACPRTAMQYSMLFYFVKLVI